MKLSDSVNCSKKPMLKIIFLSLFILSGCVSADKHLQEISDLNAKNRELEWQSLEKQKEIAALEAEKNLNDKFEKMRRAFTKNEADVYRQGNALTIRLKGLKFPSSESNLVGDDFTLLAKVQKVIKEFNNSSVLIEGHADASGGKRVNTKVAKQRAQTVRDYFISNGIINKDKIKAIGYKDDMPVATNKTSVGKAQNRRVDVVITL